MKLVDLTNEEEKGKSSEESIGETEEVNDEKEEKKAHPLSIKKAKSLLNELQVHSFLKF